MKTIAFFLSCVMLSNSTMAGNVVVNNCRTHAACVVQQHVQEVVTVPVNVAFVPSQVLLNGQVTTYGAAQVVTYSYQGPLASDTYQRPQPQQPSPTPQPPQPGNEVDPNPINVQSTGLDKRMDRIEAMMDKLLKANGINDSVAASSVPVTPAKQELLNKGYDMLMQNCVKCHKPGSSGSFEKIGKEGITMTDSDGNLYRDQEWKRIALATIGTTATMPKGPNKLDVATQMLIQKLSE